MSNELTGNDSAVEVLEKVKVQPPKMWKVVLVNDDKTTMEFVILVLMQIFHKTFEDATEIMTYVHTNGRGTAGIYSYEVASQKKEETVTAARANSFPLQVELEDVD